MKQKKPEKPKEQKGAEVRRGELSDFHELLDKLLPLGKELLSEVIEEKQKHLVDIRDKEKDDLKYALEFEKAKNSCWKEYANIFFAQYQRLSADYENFQKRAPKQVAEAIAYEKEKIIKTLLPALDNLEHTLTNAHSAASLKEGRGSAEDVDVFVKGIRIIYDQMLDILKSHGIKQIKAVGEKFDPALHEAMTQKTEPGKEENIVLEEFQTGYKLNGRAIRPSRVIVNKPPREQTTDEYETTDTE